MSFRLRFAHNLKLWYRNVQTAPASQLPSRSLRSPERDAREWNSNNRIRASSSSLEKSPPPANSPPATRSASDDRRWSFFYFIVMPGVSLFHYPILVYMPFVSLGSHLDLVLSFPRKMTEQFTYDDRLSSPRSRAKQHRRDNHSTRAEEEEATYTRWS